MRCLSHNSSSTSPRCPFEAESQHSSSGRLRGPAKLQCRAEQRNRPAREPVFSLSKPSNAEGQILEARDGLNTANGVSAAPNGTQYQASSRFSSESLASQCSQLENSTAMVCTDFIAETLLPTSSGQFRLRGYRHTIHLEDGTELASEPSVIMTGRPEGQESVVMRVHDACFTSEVLGSLKCDCADQLQLAMDYIQENPGGLIVYLQQEGRGIGLANKIAAYALQEQGLDTVDANRQLGLPDDAREYTSVRNILADLNIKSVKLMTNNPRKIAELERLGITVTQRIPCIVQAQRHNLGYLSAKRNRMDHLFGEDKLDGSFCYWNHSGEPTLALGGTKQEVVQSSLDELVDEDEIQSPRRSELKDIQEAVRKQES